ncbi:MAG: hypothetical protein J1E80_01725 [Desulfovibrionaceae bacterium]|nr:hypothetical protein [Desulfovibrionaceae bacterium]
MIDTGVGQSNYPKFFKKICIGELFGYPCVQCSEKKPYWRIEHYVQFSSDPPGISREPAGFPCFTASDRYRTEWIYWRGAALNAARTLRALRDACSLAGERLNGSMGEPCAAWRGSPFFTHGIEGKKKGRAA